MSEAEWAATERERLDLERVGHVLDRITVKRPQRRPQRRRVYRPTPEKARRRRFWMRVKWVDDHVARHMIPWLCDAVMDGGWRRGS